jgi:hypothetical protein
MVQRLEQEKVVIVRYFQLWLFVIARHSMFLFVRRIVFGLPVVPDVK